MGERIGEPLTEVVGRPRVLPRVKPQTMPKPVKETTEVPVPVRTAYRGKVAKRFAHDVESAVNKAAHTLGVEPAWVAGKLLEMASRIEAMLNMGRSGSSYPAQGLQKQQG